MRPEFFHLIGSCISVSESISFIKIFRNRKNAEMYTDIVGPYRDQFLISQAVLFAIGAMAYPVTFLIKIESGLGAVVYLFIIFFRRTMLWVYKKKYSA